MVVVECSRGVVRQAGPGDVLLGAAGYLVFFPKQPDHRFMPSLGRKV